MRTLYLTLALALGGCFLNNVTPEKKLSETVRDTNNAAHWGRVGQAALSVASKYRSTFVAKRAHWTGNIQLAEHEVVHMQMSDDGMTAIAMVSCSWYGLSDMSLHSTVFQQTWKNFDGEFALVSEMVVRGDATLFADVPEPEEGEGAETKPAPLSESAADQLSMSPPR